MKQSAKSLAEAGDALYEARRKLMLSIYKSIGVIWVAEKVSAWLNKRNA